MDNEEKLAKIWKQITDDLISIQVSLIKLRNHIPNSSLKKSMVRDIDAIRAQVNQLELGSRGK